MDLALENKKIALVMGSGASRGLAYIGVLKVLEERGIKPQILVGTSMGAMIGGAYAAELSASQIEDIACETNWLKVAQILFPKKIQGKALLDGERVQDFLLALLGERRIEDLDKQFACIAADIWNGEEIVLDSGSLTKAIRASISFPFLFAPYELDGRQLVDGGVVNPLPVNIARNMGADYVIAVGATPSPARPTRHLNSGRILTRDKIRAAANANSFLKRLFKSFDEDGMLRKALNGQKKKRLKKPGLRKQMVQIGTTMENTILALRLKESPPDLLISPQVDDFQFFDFARANEIIARGEIAAEKAFDLFDKSPTEKGLL